MAENLNQILEQHASVPVTKGNVIKNESSKQKNLHDVISIATSTCIDDANSVNDDQSTHHAKSDVCVRLGWAKKKQLANKVIVGQ